MHHRAKLKGMPAMCHSCYNKKEDVSMIPQQTVELQDHDELGKLTKANSPNAYCCGCGSITHRSNHYCIHTGRKVIELCYHPS
jgi:hypothetical protein